MQKLNRYDMQMLHFAILVLTLYCYYADKKKRTSFKSLIPKKARTWRLNRNLKVTINSYQKQYLPITPWNKKHLPCVNSLMCQSMNLS